MLVSLCLSLTMFAATAPPSQSELSDQELLQHTEQAFVRGVAQKADPDQARKEFREASRGYEALYRRGVCNPDLLRNLGNAEFLADRLPEAILAWRLGLELAPEDAVLHGNLEYARKQVAYPPGKNVSPPVQSWTDRLRPQWLLWSLIVSHLLFWILALRWWMGGGVRCLLLALGCLALGLGFAVVLVWQDRVEQYRAEHPLVIVAAEQITFFRGNGESYPPHPDVPELFRGMEARLLCQRGDWLQIELGSGQAGWIPRSAALVASQAQAIR